MLLIAANRSDRLSERANAAAARWAAVYWRSPIPAQGRAPDAYHLFAKGIRAEDCGSCHPMQWHDWQASLHGLTMGPGVTAQLDAMSPQERSDCVVCHAPMSEQWAARYRLALERARSKPYTLFHREVPIAVGSPPGARR
jgi:hypothetical protein